MSEREAYKPHDYRICESRDPTGKFQCERVEGHMGKHANGAPKTTNRILWWSYETSY